MTIVKAHDASLRGVEHVLGHWTHEKSLPKALSMHKYVKAHL